MAEEPYRPFTLSKSRQNRVDNAEKIKKKYDNKIVAKRLAKKLTRDATPAEKILIKALKEAKIQFFFQRRLAKHDRFCIADFMIKCERKKFIIELDGSHHYTPEGLAKDAERTQWIWDSYKISVKRFANSTVYNNLPKVMEWIEKQNPKRLL